MLSRVFLAERFSLPRAVAVALAFGGADGSQVAMNSNVEPDTLVDITSAMP